jgi:GH25 family lysozyme M1 (1,4-beta-N-acetylmuramidase)
MTRTSKKRQLGAGARKTLYVATLVFPAHKSDEIYASLTEKQAAAIAAWLDKEKAKGPLVDYYLGPPFAARQLHIQFLTEPALRAQLKDLIDLERSRPS